MILLLCLLPTQAFAQEFPKLSGRVVDAANVIPDAQEAALTQTLAALERETSDRLVVVTIPDLGEVAIERYSTALGNHWGIGRRDLNNGVLIVVAPSERKARIEVGSGLEGLLTDDRAKTIMDRSMLPQFRQGDLGAGIGAGAEAIVKTLRSDRRRPMPKSMKDAG